jgi:hypothetical protein
VSGRAARVAVRVRRAAARDGSEWRGGVAHRGTRRRGMSQRRGSLRHAAARDGTATLRGSATWRRGMGEQRLASSIADRRIPPRLPYDCSIGALPDRSPDGAAAKFFTPSGKYAVQ